MNRTEGAWGRFDRWPQQKNVFYAMPTGLQSIAVEFSAYTKKSLEDGLSTAEQLLRARTLSEVIAIHTEFLDRWVDGFFAEWGKIADLLIGGQNQAFRAGPR